MVEKVKCVHCRGSGVTTYDCCIEASFPGVSLPPGPLKKALAGPRRCCVCEGKGFNVVGEERRKIKA